MGRFDYDVHATLAVSTRSVVRRAVRKLDGLPVILKSPAEEPPTSDDLWHLEFEFRLLQRLNVPSVVRAIALDRSVDLTALVLEDFGGENPRVVPGGLPLRAFFPIALQAARGLGAIHDAGVVHKDIKPSNLLVSPVTGELKLIDFHLASELASERQELTAVGQIEGSLPYLSPEQTGRMNRELDYRSDYYSLGVTLFELLTGQLPLPASDAMGYVHAHLSKRAPRADHLRPEVPSPLAGVLAKLMAKDPDERYQSASGIVHDLERCHEAWRTGGAVSFALGERDVSARFAIPQKLLGREEETTQLDAYLREVCAGGSRLVLVSGPSGIGKSALVRELHGPATRATATFVTGKFEQLERSVPYGALVQALRALVKQALFEAEARLDALRRSLRDALGTNAGLLTALIPELSQLLGAQPTPAALGAAEAQHRFRRVVRDFLRVFATAAHPLVLFIDDLQWMDASTPELLLHWFGDERVPHLLLLGAYRDTEVTEGHRLTLFLRELRARRAEVLGELRVEPLRESAVNDLVAETLRAPREQTRPLTALLYERTEGNPLFVSELLSSLHRAGVFSFEQACGRFVYDLERVRRVAVSETVAELIVARLAKLSPAVRRAIAAAACIGTEFELGALADLTGQGPASVAASLLEALAQRVLVPLDGSYRLLSAGSEQQLGSAGIRFRFQHDRVERAAYQLLPDDERAALHAALGRRLARRASPADDVFEIVNHLRLGAPLLTADERAELLRLHLRAATKADAAAAYAIAARELDYAIELAKREPTLAPHERFSLHSRHVQATFVSGDVERAATLCEELFELAPDSVARGAVFALKTRILEYRGKLLEAVATIRAGLRLFGVELPESQEDIERGIGEGIQKMQRHLERVPVEQLANLPELREPERVMTLELLFQVIPPAIQTHPPLFVLAELLMFDIALRHGVTQLSCKNFVDCGIIQGGILGDYDVAYRLGQTALRMLERYRPTPLESSVTFVFSAFVSHFKRPAREGFQLYERAARAGLELGDVQHLAYATVHRSHRSLLVGVRLIECEQEAKEALRFLEGARAAGQLVGMLVSTWSLARLRDGETMQPSAGRTEEEVLRTLKEAGNAQWLFSFGQAQTWVSYLLGDVAEATRWQAFTDAFAPAGACLFAEVDYELIRALLRLESSELSGSDSDLLGRAREKLRRWATSCAENFAHKLELFEAELARATGRPLGEVLAHYEAALTATGGDFVPFAALIHERQGRYLTSMGQTHLARSSMQRAFQLYQAWGATAKVSRLARELPDLDPAASPLALRPQRSESATTRSKLDLDLVSVLKATRAISSEVELERLFRALMDAIIENAGAELGCLVLCDDPGRPPEVRAWAAVDDAVASALRPAPLDSAERVCRDAVRYVMRSHDSVVLDDAMTTGAFTGDPYVQRQGVRSLLCVPVLNRGALLAVLYAENNATRSAFTRARIETASVIASQAAISLSNALLYQSLEQKVSQRTRELADKNREIAAMLDGMEQGIFTIDEQLRIQPQFSAHLAKLLGSRCLSGERFGPLLFRGANLRPDQVAATETALRFCFDAPVFLAEANLTHAVRSFEVPSADGEHKFFEVDWNLVVDATERVQKILVAVRDVTLLRRLTELAQRREREADIVGQILDSGLERFRDFRASAERRLGECRRLLEREGPLEADAVLTLLRNAHTIKGNARLYGYSHLVDAVHELEDAYSELRAGRAQTVTRAQLSEDLRRVSELLGQYGALCEQKLGPLSQTRDSRLGQLESELRALLGDRRAQDDPASTLTRVARALERLSATPLTELVKDTSRMFPSLAEELSKSVPLVECHDAERTQLDVKSAEVLREVLVHAFRNSLDHGIEPADERLARGKLPQGKVKLRAERRPDAVLLRLSDDGRGLPLEALRLRTGLTEADDEDLAETVFASGVSTASAVSPISGRGVGMELIRCAVRKLGGEARIAFTAPREQGFRPFELLVSLPMTH